MTHPANDKPVNDRVWGLALLRGHVHHGNPCRCQPSGNDAAKRTVASQEGAPTAGSKVESEQSAVAR